jgi:hypothetical protein
MIVSSTKAVWPDSPDWSEQTEALKAADRLPQMVVIALNLGLLLARWLLEGELERRAKEKSPWHDCVSCGKRLHSKGWEARQMQTLVGKIA